MRPSLIPLVALLVSLASCASDGSGTSSRRTERAGGGSIWDQLSAARGNQAERARYQQQLEEGAKDLPAGWKEKIDAFWRLWRKNDGGWPDARKQWTELGDGATNILVENLIRYYVLAFSANNGHEHRRTHVELLNFKQEATPYLVQGLGSNVGDDVVKSLCAELLADFGPTVLPAVYDAYDDSDWRGQWALLRALKRQQSQDAVPFLSRVASNRQRFELRIEALEALGRIGDRRAVPSFLQCMKDDDPSVRKFAAHYVAALKDTSPAVLESLVGCLETSTARGDGEGARACQTSLTRLMGVNLGTQTEAWRQAIRQRGGF